MLNIFDFTFYIILNFVSGKWHDKKFDNLIRTLRNNTKNLAYWTVTHTTTNLDYRLWRHSVSAELSNEQDGVMRLRTSNWCDTGILLDT